jgi:hypothetical protein
MLTTDLVANMIIGLYFLSALDSLARFTREGGATPGPSREAPSRTRAG